MVDWRYRDYQQKINEEKKQLRERLDKYKYFSIENYNLFLSILNLEVNVWNMNIPEEVFKIPDSLFADIVKFNLKNYMLNFLVKKVDNEIIYFDDSEEDILIRVEMLTPVASMELCKDDELGKKPRGILKLHKQFYDEEYNKTRIEFMKKLLELYMAKSNYSRIDATLLSNQISRMELAFNGFNTFYIADNFEKLCRQFRDSKEILDVLLKEYKVKFSELSIDDYLDYHTFRNIHLPGPVSLSTDLDNYGCLDYLLDMFHNETLTSTTCVQDDEKGKVYTIKHIHDLYKEDAK